MILSSSGLLMGRFLRTFFLRKTVLSNKKEDNKNRGRAQALWPASSSRSEFAFQRKRDFEKRLKPFNLGVRNGQHSFEPQHQRPYRFRLQNRYVRV